MESGGFAAWLGENKRLAIASSAALLFVVGGLGALYGLFQARREALAMQAIAVANEERALQAEQMAARRAEEVLRLSALEQLADLVAEADQLWPAQAENIPRYEAWLARANALVAELPQHEAKLAELRQRARPPAGEVQEPGGRREWSFDSSEDRWWHDQLTKLVEGLRAFSDPETGLLSEGVSPEHGWGIRKRLESARAASAPR